MSDTTITAPAHAVLAEQYKYVRSFTEHLCEPLLIEDYVVQPIIDVSPPKWHLAHSTWFFENFILKPHLADYQEYHRYFGYLFNSYYESAGKRWQRANRGQLTRPSVEEVYAYRHYVDEQMQKLFSQNTLSDEVMLFLEIGLHHEQQHQELLFTDIKYILGSNPLFPVYKKGVKPSFQITEKPDWIKVSEGIYQTGHQAGGFSYDNETPVHQVFLADFEIRRQAVTNAEWLEFMEAGGYQNHELWLSEGRAWVIENNVEAPLYWLKETNTWQQYTLGGGLTYIDLTAPVTHISYYEADAFAAWKGMRLPTEHEWEAACRQVHGSETIPPEAVFANNDYLQPQACGNNSLYGNVWQWTASAYLSYPNYRKAPGALGEYNGKFMSGQMVLRGGSCATDKSHIRCSYRNFFHPDKRWQFTGLRLVKIKK